MIDVAALKSDHPILAYAQGLTPLHRKGRDRAGGEEWAGPCPIPGCPADTDGFVVFSGEGRFLCRGCGHTGDVIALDAAVHGGAPGDAMRRLGGRPVPRLPKARATATPTRVDTTLFEDANGRPGLRKDRYEPGFPTKDGTPRDKSFVLYHPDPDAPAGWARGKPPGDLRVMFNLRACLAAPAGSTIYFTEGELKAKALIAAGYLATCRWEGGTAWQPFYRAPFLDQHLVILEDNDKTGRDLTAAMLPDALAVAASVRVVAFPECGEGGDLIDWRAAGHTWADFDQAVAATPVIQALPVPVPDPPAAPPARFRVLTDAESDAIPPLDWLVEGHILRGLINVAHGDGGSGKSLTCLDLALTLASGQTSWHGHACSPGPVLYLAAEGPEEISQRKRAWKAAFGHPALPDFYLVPDQVPFMDATAIPDLVASLPPGCAAPVLIVVDTLARAMAGDADENATRDMNGFVVACDTLRAATGAAVLVIHHDNKAGQFRGNLALLNAARSSLKLQNDDGLITCEVDKHNNTGAQGVLRFGIHPAGDSVVVRLATPEDRDTGRALREKERQVLEALTEPAFKNGATLTMLRDATGLPNWAIFRALNTLMKRKLVGESGTPRTQGHNYKATAPGYKYLNLTPPWQAVLDGGVTASDSARADDLPVSRSDDPGSDTGGVAASDTPAPAPQAGISTISSGLAAELQGSSTPTGGVTHISTPLYKGANVSHSDPVPDSDSPDPIDPDPAAPRWDTPPDAAPPRPPGCLRGHHTLSQRWDTRTAHWRCASCWGLHRE